MTDEERFAMAITALAESFRQKASPGLFHGYRLGLKGLSIDAIEQACGRALQRCKFMPVPAELRELAAGDGGGFDAMAERAFHTLQQTVKSMGSDYSVNFQDGAINAVVRLLGGWVRVCELPTEEFDKWFRKDFLATYVRVCRDGASEDLRRYHGGRLERDNAHWHGRTLPHGGIFKLGDYGTGVHAIGVEYKPALPAPEPRELLSANGSQIPRLEIKRVE